MQDDLAGDIKKLKGASKLYRLRVGDYRVLFELEGDLATVYDVSNRKDAYR
jgi:mRNA interferase RelE/StbE